MPKPQKTDNIDEKISNQLSVFIEHMNDQFERVLEAVDSKTEPIAKMSDSLEVIEAETKMNSLKIESIKHDTKMLKLRSDNDQKTKQQVLDELTLLRNRVKKLELSA